MHVTRFGVPMPFATVRLRGEAARSASLPVKFENVELSKLNVGDVVLKPGGAYYSEPVMTATPFVVKEIKPDEALKRVYLRMEPYQLGLSGVTQIQTWVKEQGVLVTRVSPLTP